MFLLECTATNLPSTCHRIENCMEVYLHHMSLHTSSRTLHASGLLRSPVEIKIRSNSLRQKQSAAASFSSACTHSNSYRYVAKMQCADDLPETIQFSYHWVRELTQHPSLA